MKARESEKEAMHMECVTVTNDRGLSCDTRLFPLEFLSDELQEQFEIQLPLKNIRELLGNL